MPRLGHMRGHAGLAAVKTLSLDRQRTYLRSQMIHPRDHEENNPTMAHRSRGDWAAEACFPGNFPEPPPLSPCLSSQAWLGACQILPHRPLITWEGACPFMCRSPLLGSEHLGQRIFPNLDFYSLQLRLCSAVLGSQG